MHCIIKSSLKCLKHIELLTTRTRFLANFQTHLDSIEHLVIKHAQEESPDWIAIRKEAVALDPNRITPNNVDYVILSQCNDDSTRRLAVDYARCLQNNGTALNLAAISKLLKIYGFVQMQKGPKSIQNIDIEAEIIKLYQQLTEKHKVLDVSLSESVICALSTTKQWKDCLPIMKSIQDYGSPTGLTYIVLISVLFANGEEESAWHYLQQLVEKDKTPGSSVFHAFLSFLDTFDDYTQFVQRAERMFNFWSMNDLLIEEDVACKLMELFTKRQKKATLTTISVKGDCSKCKTRLPETALSDDDFKNLKSAFFKNVIIGKDVFRKTSPTELTALQQFLADKQHYDVIIDGLNVAYSKGVHKSVQVTSGLVASVVEHYTRQNKSVLVLGRNHMKKWPHVRKIQQHAKLFLTQNLSQDDPYLLYCALSSGRGTIIVSRDMMRGHLYLLKEPYLKQLFKRWLTITRHQLLTQRRDGKLIINAPPVYIQSAQKLEQVWHLPIMEKKNTAEAKNSFLQKSEPTLWLCIQL